MNQHAQGATRTTTHELFSLGATYLIAPDADSRDLQTDIGCILESTIAATQTVIDGLSDPASTMAANPADAIALLYGALYQMKMVRGIAAALEVRS